MNINQHYQTCHDLQCPLFDVMSPDKGCGALKCGNCRYQTIHIIQNAPEINQKLNGKEHGLYRCWYGSGKLEIECNCVNGKLRGLYKRWYGNGEVMMERNYQNS